jgi:tRNA pseudouridine32 synthase/23S rRNA pseudouridine746 synthase
MAMSIANQASEITLPPVNPGCANLLEFLCRQFPRVAPDIWQARFADGKIHWFGGEMVTATTPFSPSRRLCYYREVVAEPKIPFAEQLVYQDEHILVACKPHFLPVTPGGDYVNECLLVRLKQQYQLDDLVAVHRLDRETAGLVLFSKKPQSRAAYYQLFASGQIQKSYQAVAALPADGLSVAGQQCSAGQKWQVQNRLEKSNPTFLMQQVEGEINARSNIHLLEIKQGFGLFELEPLTGKTHQLRVHMLGLGLPLLYDKYYPELLPKTALEFSQPLQLLAKTLSFIDPISGKPQHFCSERQLQSWSEFDN